MNIRIVTLDGFVADLGRLYPPMPSFRDPRSPSPPSVDPPLPSSSAGPSPSSTGLSVGAVVTVKPEGVPDSLRHSLPKTKAGPLPGVEVIELVSSDEEFGNVADVLDSALEAVLVQEDESAPGSSALFLPDSDDDEDSSDDEA